MSNLSYSRFIKARLMGLFLCLLFIAQTSLSCRQKQADVPSEPFEVWVDMTAYKDNSIQLFYVTKSDDSYSEEQSLRKKISGSQKSQRLVFKLPKGVKVKNIRLDLGETANENDSIKLENIRFSYRNLELNGAGGAYKSWFVFNDNVVQGKNNQMLYLKKSNNTFDPQLNGNRKLNALLVKLFPPNIYEQ
jgi:hypothetical protein